MIRLRPEALEKVRRLIRDAHIRVAIDLYGVDAVPSSLVEDLLRRRVISKRDVVGPPGMLGGAYSYGVAHGRELVKQPMAHATRPRTFDPSSVSLDSWQQRAADAARERGASLILGLGEAAADGIATAAMTADEFDARQQRAIAGATATAIERREGVGRLRSRLFDTIVQDRARDLDRIAATELTGATNAGISDAIAEVADEGDRVAVLVNPDACKTCVRHYTSGGKPRIFKLAELHPWGANFKVKAANMVTTVPPLHPWCHCTLIYVPAGFGFDDSGALARL